MSAAEDAIGDDTAAETARAKIAEAGRKMARYKAAIDAGGDLASLAANVAVAEPTAGRVIAAGPSLALISAYELLMRQVRRGAVSSGRPRHS
jgi:hypothetical protein